MSVQTELFWVLPQPGARGTRTAAPFGIAARWTRLRRHARRARRHSVALACAATLAVHLLSLTRQLGADEGGFAMVARYAHAGGPFLYGPQWVDRPPGLIAVFALAGRLGPYGVRLMASLLAVVLVASLAWGAHAVGGRLAAGWAAWAGFGLASSVLLEAQRLNGELVAATFVTICVAAVLQAVRGSAGSRRTALLGALAGASATAAVLAKQNFVDGFVFAAVLVWVALLTRANRQRYPPRRMMLMLGGFCAGASVPSAATVVWSHSHGGLNGLLYAVFGFRADALAVMDSWSWAAPTRRLETLGELGFLSGVIYLLLHLTFSHRGRLLAADPLSWGIAATAAVEGFGVLAGANFWSHYLIALIPMVALGAGLGVRRSQTGWRTTRQLVVLCALTTALVSPVQALYSAGTTGAAWTTGRWVAASAHPDDTLVVPFTHANVLDASRLAPAYPYSWSLPVRVLDPRLSLLTSTLEGGAAPTWVVRWEKPHTWGLDPGNHVANALTAHYQPVALVCGHFVWLHDGRSRSLAAIPPASACGAGDR